MIATALTELLNVRVPLLSAPMTPQAGGLLARSVSAAGAFGMVGIEEIDTEEGIAEQLAIVTEAPRVPFGIGLVAWVIEARPELLEIAIAAKPDLISISFGDAGPYVPRIREAGILVASQVQSRKWAEVALDAQVDVLVAQGTEAGGHTGAVGTLPLLQIVLEMTDRPVVAAGGIATGRGLAAVIAAGAAGAWIGTPFLLADEARNSPGARSKIVEADETQTLYTSVYDRLQDKKWPAEFRARALSNPFGANWTGREDELGDRHRPTLAVRGGEGCRGLRRRAHLRRPIRRAAPRDATCSVDRVGAGGRGRRASCCGPRQARSRYGHATCVARGSPAVNRSGPTAASRSLPDAWNEPLRVGRILGVRLTELLPQQRLLPGNPLDVTNRRENETRCETQCVPEPEAHAREHEHRTRVRRVAQAAVGADGNELVVGRDLELAREPGAERADRPPAQPHTGKTDGTSEDGPEPLGTR